MNEEKSGSATSFSSVLKSKDRRIAINNDGVSTRVTNIYIIFIIFLFNSKNVIIKKCTFVSSIDFSRLGKY